VVAARRGIGGVQAQGGNDSAFCRVVGCDSGNGPINLRDPPAGYSVANAQVALGTLEGSVPLIDTPPLQAEKILPPEGEPVPKDLPPAPEIKGFPTTSRFALAAKLRAGALMRDELFWRVSEVAPIDVYTQYIVKITVAAFPGAKLETGDDVHIPSRESTGTTSTVTNNDPWKWLKSPWLLALLGGVVLIAAAVVILYVKGILGFPFKLLKK
jgi:hypothetical protein